MVVPGQVVVDPSRVAAQIVSGLGFIGAGLIFVQRGSVRGFTTAATIWFTAAMATAAAAGLVVLAVLCTVGHFTVLYGLTPLARRLSGNQPATAVLSCTYVDGHGVLRDLLRTCTDSGWVVTAVETRAGRHCGRPGRRLRPGAGAGPTRTARPGLGHGPHRRAQRR